MMEMKYTEVDVLKDWMNDKIRVARQNHITVYGIDLFDLSIAASANGTEFHVNDVVKMSEVLKRQLHAVPFACEFDDDGNPVDLIDRWTVYFYWGGFRWFSLLDTDEIKDACAGRQIKYHVVENEYPGREEDDAE